MSRFDAEIDTSGLNCPLPVLKARKALAGLESGARLQLIVTDPGANKDIPAFCKMSGNILVETWQDDDRIFFLLEKASPAD